VAIQIPLWILDHYPGLFTIMSCLVICIHTVYFRYRLFLFLVIWCKQMARTLWAWCRWL